ncbi:hypothetical protein [Cystobacter ferrugineus]|uniref:hypothetical protein n=1 Tax=Cystobacter ferrugineus TaxID=83449 RepID=UPI00116152E7|nr:hypothetical protein [Cystobacter ferrugineus]
MMKTLKMGLLGLAMGSIGAVAFPAHEAEANEAAQLPTGNCCSTCNPQFQRCLNSSGNTRVGIEICNAQRSICESSCVRIC